MQHLETFALKEAKRFKLKVGVFLCLIKNDQILLLRRYQTGIQDGMYVLPMGGHDGKISLTQALVREAKEETDIMIQPNQAEVCHVMHRFHPMPQGLSFEQIDVFFKVSNYEGVITNMEPDKCDELKFHPLHQLPATTAPFIRSAIGSILQGKLYSEFGWPQ